VKMDNVYNQTSAGYGSCIGFNASALTNASTGISADAGSLANIVTFSGISSNVAVGISNVATENHLIFAGGLSASYGSSTVTGAMTNGPGLFSKGESFFIDGLSTCQYNVIKTTSSSEPTVSKTNLFQSYGELESGLTQLAESEDEDWTIEPTVHNAARYVASTLMGQLCPAPKVFSHGPKSVVFNWSEGSYNLYWTISAHKIDMLFSSHERIEKQRELDFTELISRDQSFFEPNITSDLWVRSVALSGANNIHGLLL
jgi:hypothetical protein